MPTGGAAGPSNRHVRAWPSRPWGPLEAQATGPAGDVSYRDRRSTSWPKDPFLVLGIEKHDVQHSPYAGWLDELRLSTVLRYTADFTSPTAPFGPDGATAALYHFDEGSGTAILDGSGAAGGPSHGVRLFGGDPAGPDRRDRGRRQPWPAGSLGAFRITAELPLVVIEDDNEDSDDEPGDYLLALPHAANARAAASGFAVANLGTDEPGGQVDWKWTDDPGESDPDDTSYTYTLGFELTHCAPGLGCGR